MKKHRRDYLIGGGLGIALYIAVKASPAGDYIDRFYTGVKTQFCEATSASIYPNHCEVEVPPVIAP